jgi:dolichol-phosphate mannosyltransferase
VTIVDAQPGLPTRDHRDPGRAGAAPAPGEQPPRQTVVIPTYNERENVVPLLERLSQILPAASTEILFVDDSTDDTPEVIRRAASSCPIPVTVHHRDEAIGGLGGAVVEGFRLARGSWIVVMDGDLQHPPEVVPQLVAAGIRDGADLVVASRYAHGGSRKGLADGYRRLVSSSSTVATKLVFRASLTQLSDPLSGFFAVRRSSLEIDELQPYGYKILLELVVRNRPGRVGEVPYTFEARHAGESKSSVREGLRFLRHLAVLRTGSTRLRMFVYGLVGLSGLVPNAAALWYLAELSGMHYLSAAVIANQVALAWNFALTEMLFRRRRHRRLATRIAQFFLLGNLDLVLRVPVLAYLVDGAHVHYLYANVVTLVASFLIRFAIVDRVIYARRPRTAATAPDPA